jgi:exonuclease-1
MANDLVKCLKARGDDFYIAPYEADSQLAFLAKSGMVSAVITEDSDLLVFGCPKVLFKLDNSGSCVEINQADFGNIKGMKFWSFDRFRQMCILSGCDYLESPPGIGLKTAMKHLHRNDAYELIKLWQRWGTGIKAPKIPPDYLQQFQMAEQAFLYARVYDPLLKKIVHLNPLSTADESVISSISDIVGV